MKTMYVLKNAEGEYLVSIRDSTPQYTHIIHDARLFESGLRAVEYVSYQTRGKGVAGGFELVHAGNVPQENSGRIETLHEDLCTALRDTEILIEDLKRDYSERIDDMSDLKRRLERLVKLSEEGRDRYEEIKT